MKMIGSVSCFSSLILPVFSCCAVFCVSSTSRPKQAICGSQEGRFFYSTSGLVYLDSPQATSNTPFIAQRPAQAAAQARSIFPRRALSTTHLVKAVAKPGCIP